MKASVTRTKQPEFAQTLLRAGFTREHNGGGSYVWTKPVGLWVMSVCNGAAGEPHAYDTRVHVNAHWHDDCEKFIPGFWVRVTMLGQALTGWEMVVQGLSRDQEGV